MGKALPICGGPHDGQIYAWDGPILELPLPPEPGTVAASASPPPEPPRMSVYRRARLHSGWDIFDVWVYKDIPEEIQDSFAMRKLIAAAASAACLRVLLRDLEAENTRLAVALKAARDCLADMHDDQESTCLFNPDRDPESGMPECLACYAQEQIAEALEKEQPDGSL